MCCRADVRHLRVRERVGSPAFELGPAAHRVLELRAVRLDAERRARCRTHRRAHQHVVREDEVGGQQLAHCGGVRFDVCGTLVRREVLEELRCEARVAVHDEHRQKAAGELDVHHPRTGQVVLLRRALLADDHDVVPGAAPLSRECARVDVRPRPAEQVPVPEHDSHRAEARPSLPNVSCTSVTLPWERATPPRGRAPKGGMRRARRGGSRARAAARPRGSTCAPSPRRARRAAPRSS